MTADVAASIIERLLNNASTVADLWSLRSPVILACSRAMAGL